MKFLLSVSILLSTSLHLFAADPVDWVDPKIGGVGILLVPTRPTVHLPNGMVRVYPMKRDQLDDRIGAFPLSIISHRLGELFSVMPGNGGFSDDNWDSPQSYDLERSTPYYYSARLDDSLITAEFTPSAQAGVFRFTFPDKRQILRLGVRTEGKIEATSDGAVSGVERFKGMAAYFYATFDRPMDFHQVDTKRLTASPTGSGEVIEMRYGLSFISAEQARENLKKEIGTRNFEAVSSEARSIWNKTLGQIVVKGGTDAQKRVFYTSLYRCYERMINITEDGRYYSSYDHKVHEDPRPFYVDNWIWDTYQSLEPLHILLNPATEADKLQSYVRMYEQSGWMPSFAVLWGDYPCMNGNHAAPWMADAWFKGVRDFDLKTGFEGLRKNSIDSTLLPWVNGPKTALDDFYNAHGYFPSLGIGEEETEKKVVPNEMRQAVAVTLENSFDDWCIAQLAEQLGKEGDRELFLKRAANYKNVYRAEKGFMWPRDSSGNWIDPIDPKIGRGRGGRHDFDENSAYTYNWSVRHDWQGLIELMGGTSAAEMKLDQLFREDLGGMSKYEFFALYPDSTGLVGQFVAGNEPSFPIPYLYHLTGSPWKTQKRIRMLMDAWFTDTLFGIPGDEDGGGISSYIVFSMMGFYPLVPGVPAYCLGSPVFDEIQIHLTNGKTISITAKNNSRDNKYIQSFALNGKPSNVLWFRHADIAEGAAIELEMGDTPNKTLGTKPGEFPPSFMMLNPASLE